MTRTGEEVKAKYEKQWTRAPARVSLYKTPCPPDLPLFRGCWRQPAAAAVFTPAVCRACTASRASLPLLAPEAALRSSTLRRSIRPRRACGKFDEWQAGRFPTVSARGIPRCGATRGDCPRKPTTDVCAPTLGAHSRYPHSPQVVVVRTLWPKTNKAMFPNLGNIAS